MELELDVLYYKWLVTVSLVAETSEPPAPTSYDCALRVQLWKWIRKPWKYSCWIIYLWKQLYDSDAKDNYLPQDSTIPKPSLFFFELHLPIAFVLLANLINSLVFIFAKQSKPSIPWEFRSHTHWCRSLSWSAQESMMWTLAMLGVCMWCQWLKPGSASWEKNS